MPVFSQASSFAAGALITGLLHAPYTPGQATYDLRRLRLTGIRSWRPTSARHRPNSARPSDRHVKAYFKRSPAHRSRVKTCHKIQNLATKVR
jgi:hypothetical protein